MLRVPRLALSRSLVRGFAGSALALPSVDEVKAWDTARVVEFAMKAGLGAAATEVLKKNEINGEDLLTLTEDKLRADGMPRGPATRLATSIAERRNTRKTFVLIINRENDDGDIVPSEITVSADSSDKLEKLIRKNGGGNLVKEGDPEQKGVESIEEIADGATYSLVGGLNDALLRHRTWTQVSDKVLEDEAVKAVLSDPKLPTLYGKLEEFHDYNSKNPKCLRAADGTEEEIDGLCVNGTTAVVVEAKHHAETKHIKTAQKKALYVARVAREGGIPRLSAIEHFVPLLAANCFSMLMRKQCAEAGVGVVEPNGSRVSVTHAPPVPRAKNGTH